MNSQSVAHPVMSGGCQRRQRPVLMCCHRASPDQPRLRARHLHTKHTDTRAHTHTLHPNNIHEAQWAVCITRARTPFVNGQRLYLCREDPMGLACQRGSSFLTLPLTRSQSPHSVHVSLCPVHFSLKRAVSSN